MKKTQLVIFTLLVISLGCEKKGLDGKNSLLDLIIESAGENCPSGGYKIVSGLDLNSNGFLDENEILSEEYICNGDNGINGISSLINVIPEPSGDFCEYGGIKVESGLDQNNNGLLDNDEVNAINYVCNGDDGQSSGEISTIRIPFNLAYKWRGGQSSSWTYEIQDGLLYGFNIDNYQNFDSIIFVAQFHRQPAESTDTIWMRLFDYTIGTAIDNSELYSIIPNSQLTDPDKRVFKSMNFCNSLSSGNSTIGMQFKTGNEMSLSIHKAEIILNKSE
ncbi:MAG: hypothetical protein C0595_02665 [Marinilabiliales bacterium]|nr:MAG: hypothetical protein C0595_02665 [Marinilabiliales bacterium]